MVLKTMKRPISMAHMMMLVTSEVRNAERLYPACLWPVPEVLPGFELFELIFTLFYDCRCICR